MALLAEVDVEPLNGATTRWCAVNDLLDGTQPLAFDHHALVVDAVERLRNKVQYTSLPIHLLPEEFTLAQLQRAFEIVLGGPVEKKSFRRRIAAAEVLEEIGTTTTGPGRPAKRYRLKPGLPAHTFNRSAFG